MSAQNTPCMNPSVCGVQSHRPGTIALCVTSSGLSLSSPSSRLFQPVQPLSNTYQHQRDTVIPDRARIAQTPERDPIIHLQSNAPEPRSWRDRIKSLFGRPAAEAPQRGTDFLESALSYDVPDDQASQNQRRQEREDRMAQAWEQRLREAQQPQPMSPAWSKRLSRMEQSWEERRQQRGF